MDRIADPSFKGNEVTFESFPDSMMKEGDHAGEADSIGIVHLLQSTHPSLKVESHVFPMYQTRGELVSRWCPGVSLDRADAFLHIAAVEEVARSNRSLYSLSAGGDARFRGLAIRLGRPIGVQSGGGGRRRQGQSGPYGSFVSAPRPFDMLCLARSRIVWEDCSSPTRRGISRRIPEKAIRCGLISSVSLVSRPSTFWSSRARHMLTRSLRYTSELSPDDVAP